MAFPIMLLLTTAVTVNSQRNAAEAQEIELERQADQEKISAEGKELERRRRLNKVLASNIVSQASSGTAGEGTPQSIALDNAKQASLTEASAGLSGRLKQSQLKRQASSAKRSGNIQGASTLLQGASQIQQVS